MSALRLPCLGWMLAATGAMVLATLRIEPTASEIGVVLAAAVFVFLVHLPGFRSRPWLRAIGVPVLVGGVAGGLALGAYRARHHEALAFFLDDPALWTIALVVFVPLLVRMLMPPEAGGRVVRLLGVEWRKLWRGRLLWLGLLACVAVTLAVGFTHEPASGETGWAVAAVLLKSGTWMAEILLLVLGAVAIAGEIGQGTMKMILPHAYKRSDWVLAKGILLTLVAIGFMLVIGATSVLYAGTTYGLEDVVKPGEPAFGMPATLFQSADTMTAHLRDTVIASTASLVAITWLALLLSALFSSVVAALSTAFLVFVALRFGDVLLGYGLPLQERLFTSYPEWMLKATRHLGKGLNEGWKAAYLVKCLWLCGLTTVLAALASITVFDRRELS